MKKRDFTIHVAKTKPLISFAVTAKLICVFVFAHVKNLFSHDAAHIMLTFILATIKALKLISAFIVWVSLKVGFQFSILGERTGLVVRASDSRSGDPGSIPGRVGVLFP